MTKEEKCMTKTEWVQMTAAQGQREVIVESKFRFVFKPNDRGHIVCRVPTNSHRAWMYQFEWFVPYYPDGITEHDIIKVKEVEPIPEEDEMFDEKTDAFLDTSSPAPTQEKRKLEVVKKPDEKAIEDTL